MELKITLVVEDFSSKATPPPADDGPGDTEPVEPADHQAQRLDLALLSHLRDRFPEMAGLSRAALKERFQRKEILLNGRPTLPSHSLVPGQYEVTVLNWHSLNRRGASPSKQGCFIQIIHEDDEILVLNKPSGIPSVPLSDDETETAVGAALAHYPDLAKIRRTPAQSAPAEPARAETPAAAKLSPPGPVANYEPGILHRLDTGTSGLLAFAKTQAEFDRLRAAWSSGEVKKTYRALVRARADVEDAPAPAPIKPPFVIEFPLAHDSHSAKRMIALKSQEEIDRRKFRGDPLAAQTTIHSWNQIGIGLFDLEIELHTGVMHQIRCHLATLGWPILGDAIYHGVPSHRLWLHAWKLELPLKSEKTLRLEAPMPESWAHKIEAAKTGEK